MPLCAFMQQGWCSGKNPTQYHLFQEKKNLEKVIKIRSQSVGLVLHRSVVGDDKRQDDLSWLNQECKTKEKRNEKENQCGLSLFSILLQEVFLYEHSGLPFSPKTCILFFLVIIINNC